MHHTDSHASDSGTVWQEGRTILGAKSKLLYREIALSRKPFRIGPMYIYTFLLRMTDTVTSQNIDLLSWDTCMVKEEYTLARETMGLVVRVQAYQRW
jgi:hypothetical protein